MPSHCSRASLTQKLIEITSLLRACCLFEQSPRKEETMKSIVAILALGFALSLCNLTKFTNRKSSNQTPQGRRRPRIGRDLFGMGDLPPAFYTEPLAVASG